MAASVARGDLTVLLTPGVRSAAPGSEIVISGTITNTSAVNRVFLNAADTTLTGTSATYLAPDSNPFYLNVPGILAPGESYSGVIFRTVFSEQASTGDYAGTLVLRGGSNVLANDILASVPIAVLFPAVSIAVTDSVASEFGPDPGTFTISRTGRTDATLLVPYLVGGTAINGSTYATIPTSLTIPNGASSAAVVVSPITDNTAQGSRTVTLTLTSGAFEVSGFSAASLTIRDKPMDEWRLAKFGGGANLPSAADLADPERDGLSNLAEYGLLSEPLTPSVSSVPPATIAGGYLTLSYVPNAAATDLAYRVTASTDLLVWSPADVEEVSVANPIPPTRKTFRYKNPANTVPRACLRLEISR